MSKYLERLGLLCLIALAVVGIDLGSKLAAVDLHASSLMYHRYQGSSHLAHGLELTFLLILLVPVIRSSWIVSTAALLVGAGLGNLVSLAVWGGVPDFINDPIAGWCFNVADFFAFAGAFLVLCAGALELADLDWRRLI